MTYYRSRIRVVYFLVMLECFLFTSEFIYIQQKAIVSGINDDNLFVRLFIVAFFGSILFISVCSLGEIILFRKVILSTGCLILKRGLLTQYRVAYTDIIRLETKAVGIQQSQGGSLKGMSVYKGEKLIVTTKQDRVINFYSIWMSDYNEFKKKIARLAVNSKLFGNPRFVEEVNYFTLLFVGIFVGIMTWVIISS